MSNNKEEYNDYFDGADIPDVPKERKEPKKPSFKPDDPRYWDEPESEFEHLRPSRPKQIWWWVGGSVAALIIILLIYIFMFQPYAENSVQYGYVEDVDIRGYVFKTYEGTLLPYKNIMDTTRVYEGDFKFSAIDEKVAVKLRRMQNAHKPVRVVYTTYPIAYPWHGDTPYMIVAVDSVNPANILPPDRVAN